MTVTIKEETALDALEFLKNIEIKGGGTLKNKQQVTLTLDSIADVMTWYHESRIGNKIIPIPISTLPVGRKFKL